MFINCMLIIIGLIGLIWSADKFIDSSANIATQLKIPSIIIGMIVIGFGTSAPEIMVSSMAAWQGQTTLALGNAYGSNIANIGLVLGMTALIGSISASKQLLHREIPFLIFITLITSVILYTGSFTRIDSFILMILFTVFLFWIIKQFTQSKHVDAQINQTDPSQKTLMTLFAVAIISLIILIISSRILIVGAVGLAEYFGVSSLIIGLTIVAVGTSLPELAASISAIRKGEHGLILGNIIGSNIFNTLLVAGVAGMIHPMTLPTEIFYRDASTMMLATIILSIMCFSGKITRKKATLLMGGYILYLYWLFA